MFCSPLGRHSPRGTGEKGVEILDSVRILLVQLPAPAILFMARLSSSASAHLSVRVGVAGHQASKRKENRVLNQSHPPSQRIPKSTISTVNLARNY